MGSHVQHLMVLRRVQPAGSTIPRFHKERSLDDETAEPRDDVRYPRLQFLDDCLQHSDTGDHQVLQRPRTIDLIDGRLNVVDLELAHRGQIEQRRCFLRKYGSRVGSARYSRFRLVLEFLNAYRSQVCESGLAPSEPSMAVREEFLDYLLKCPLDVHHWEIPNYALRRFLDEWGHRWM